MHDDGAAWSHLPVPEDRDGCLDPGVAAAQLQVVPDQTRSARLQIVASLMNES